MKKQFTTLLATLFVAFFAVSSAAAAVEEYKIGPRDVLHVEVFNEPELTKDVVVDEKGTIRFPLLREVDLSGLTLRQAEDKVERLLGEKYLVDPQVTIVVKEYMSKRVYVLGAVKTPGYYPLTGKTTLLEIISKAGGVTETGGRTILLARGMAENKDEIEKIVQAQDQTQQDLIKDLTRAGSSGPMIIDGHRLLDEGDVSLNVELKGGDVVFIPKVKEIFVLGEVKRPGGIVYKPGLTLLQAITLAGGVTPMGRKKVLVKRKNENGAEEKFKVKLNAIIKDLTKDIALEPDDVIVVPRRVF